MSSPPSPPQPVSRFTFRHLHQLSQYSVTTPLRVIALVDLDAFYAQCEIVRLGLPPTTPLGVQQWQALIAINYPARACGLSRHATPTEAREKCPEMVLQHVATWKEGDDQWRYREPDDCNIATHKVSLDPYRLESRKILQVIKEELPGGDLQRVEKASIDEVFMDLSAHVHAILLERFPQLRGPPPVDDPTAPLPSPPADAAQWDPKDLIDGDPEDAHEPDWDDVTIAIGAEIVRGLRAAVRRRLQYTCSGGVARNKMLAKLAAGHRKPDGQTAIPNRDVTRFLAPMKFTKIRNLGGKLGDQMVSAFHTDSLSQLLPTSLDGLKRHFDDDTAQWIHSTVRGIDHSEVNPRTGIKSMLSAKSFQPPIRSWDAAVKWLRIFVADIFLRCVDEGVMEHRRRPKTMNLHFRHGNVTRSRQTPITLPPSGMNEEYLLNVAKGLLAQLVAEGRAWPCRHLSLTVAGFEDCIEGNKSIGSFVVRGDAAKAMNDGLRRRRGDEDGDSTLTTIARVGTKSVKRKRAEGEKGALHKFLRPTADCARPSADAPDAAANHGSSSSGRGSLDPSRPATPLRKERSEPPCERCGEIIPRSSKDEHADWHFASDLAAELAAESHTSSGGNPGGARADARSTGDTARGRGMPTSNGGAGRAKGQTTLSFAGRQR